MQSRNSFGSYYPVDSAMHRLNPVVKLLNFMICLLLLCLTNDLYINLFMTGLVIIMMLLSYVPLKFYFNSIWSLRFIYILIILICGYFNIPMTNAFIYIIKLIIVVEYLNILVYTTSPSETVYGIERLISPFNILYLRIGVFATKVNKLIRYIPSLLTTENKALKAGASRGIDYYHSNIFKRIYAVFIINKSLFFVTKNKNKEIEECCKYRLYNVHKRRTNYRVNKVGFYDAAFLCFHLIILFAYASIRGLI